MISFYERLHMFLNQKGREAREEKAQRQAGQMGGWGAAAQSTAKGGKRRK